MRCITGGRRLVIASEVKVESSVQPEAYQTGLMKKASHA